MPPLWRFTSATIGVGDEYVTRVREVSEELMIGRIGILMLLLLLACLPRALANSRTAFDARIRSSWTIERGQAGDWLNMSPCIGDFPLVHSWPFEKQHGMVGE